MSDLGLSDWASLATLVGVPIAVGALVWGVWQYVRDSARKSAEFLIDLRHQFKENPKFLAISTLLAEERLEEKEHPEASRTDGPTKRLEATPFHDIVSYLGLLEEVGMLVDSRFVPLGVAYYLFGTYVFMAKSSKGIWDSPRFNPGSPFWAVFFDFAGKLEAFETRYGIQSASAAEPSWKVRRYLRRVSVF